MQLRKGHRSTFQRMDNDCFLRNSKPKPTLHHVEHVLERHRTDTRAVPNKPGKISACGVFGAEGSKRHLRLGVTAEMASGSFDSTPNMLPRFASSQQTIMTKGSPRQPHLFRSMLQHW